MIDRLKHWWSTRQARRRERIADDHAERDQVKPPPTSSDPLRADESTKGSRLNR